VRTARLFSAAMIAAAGLALGACGPARPQAARAEKTVTVVAARRASISITREYAARIRPRQEIVVSPKIAGRVATVRADVSQKVARGAVLFTLESKDFDAQSRQAKAALESARANLTRTSDSSLSSQVIQAQAAVKQAQVQYDDAKDLYDRTSKLFDGGTASRQQLDSVKARFDSAGIALDTAKQNLALIQDKGGPQSTGLASTQVDQAQASLDLANSQLSNTVVTSPITGIVAARNIDPGELVSSAVPAFVVIDVASVTAEASVEGDMVDKVRRGKTVEVSVEAAGSVRLSGVVDTISPAPSARRRINGPRATR
jgi:HlyD family secretion protein